MIPRVVIDKARSRAHRCVHCQVAWVHGTPWCAAGVDYRCASCWLFLRSLTSTTPPRAEERG